MGCANSKLQKIKSEVTSKVATQLKNVDAAEIADHAVTKEVISKLPPQLQNVDVAQIVEHPVTKEVINKVADMIHTEKKDETGDNNEVKDEKAKKDEDAAKNEKVQVEKVEEGEAKKEDKQAANEEKIALFEALAEKMTNGARDLIAGTKETVKIEEIVKKEETVKKEDKVEEKEEKDATEKMDEKVKVEEKVLNENLVDKIANGEKDAQADDGPEESQLTDSFSPQSSPEKSNPGDEEKKKSKRRRKKKKKEEEDERKDIMSEEEAKNGESIKQVGDLLKDKKEGELGKQESGDFDAPVILDKIDADCQSHVSVGNDIVNEPDPSVVIADS